MREHRQAVGARLRDLRKARGLSQEDAAHLVDVTVKTWGDWERGRRDPYDANWKKIGEAFDVDPAELRGMPPPPLGLGDTEGELVARLRALERELAALRAELRAERDAHAETIRGMLEEQSGLLRDIRALLSEEGTRLFLDVLEEAFPPASRERREGEVAALAKRSPRRAAG